MKKKYLLIIVLIAACMLLSAGVTAGRPEYASAATVFSGKGTAESPYLITSLADMKLLSSLCSGENASAYLSAHYKLTKDVDMGGVVSEESGRTVWGGEAFTPIASFGGTKYQEGGSGFSGVFDGNGKKLTNLYVYSVNNYVGLFGVIDGGTVRNLVIETGCVSGKQFVGGIAGAVYGKGTITDGINGAMVYASSSHSGGIAGYVAGTSVSSRASVVRCINMGGVSSTGSYVGGIVGANEGRVYECFNIGGVAGGSVRGAVAGSNGVEKAEPCASLERVYYNKDTLVLDNNETLAPGSVCGASKVQCEDNKLTTSKMVTLYGESKPLGMTLSSSGWTFRTPSSKDSTLHYYPVPATLSYTISVEVLPGVFTVSFDLNGADGTPPASQTVREGEYASRPSDPVRSGYEFVHWATDTKEGSSAFGFTENKITDDLVLYAIWVFKDPKVSVDVSVTNGRTAKTAIYGDVVTLTANVRHGAEKVEFEWYRQGETGVVISKSATLKLTDVLQSGVYYCKVRVSDAGNTKIAYTDKVEVRISKAIDPSYSVPEVEPVTYREGLKLGDIELPEGYSWQKPDTLLNATGSAGRLFAFTFVPSDKNNYEIVQGDKIKVVVNKATYEGKTHEPITGVVYRYGLKLGDIALDADFKWVNPDTLVFAGYDQVFDAYYNAAPDNYEDFTLTISISVGKATPVVVPNTSKVNLYENTNPDKVILPTLEGSTPGECRLAEGQTLKVGVTSSYEWIFTPEDADNYVGISGTVELYVSAIRLDSIKVSKKPVKMNYTAFEEVNTEGMEIVRCFNSGDVEVVPESEYVISYVGNPKDCHYFLCNNIFGNTSQRSIRVTLLDNSDFSCDVEGFVVEKARFDLESVAHPEINLTYSPLLSFMSISGRLKENYELVDRPESLNAGYGQEFNIVYNSDEKNYYDAELVVIVNIDKAEFSDAVKNHAASVHGVLTATYKAGMTLGDIPLNDSFFWSEKDTLIKAGKKAYKAYFNSDERNYNDYELEITVSVARAVFELGEFEFDDAEFAYDGKEHGIFVVFASGAAPEGVSVTYTGNNVSRAGSYTVTAVFELTEPENYEPIKSRTAVMIIHKRDITVDFNPNFDGSFISGENGIIDTEIEGLLDGDNVTVRLKIIDEAGNILAEGDNCIERVFSAGRYTIIAEIVDDNYKIKAVTEMPFTVKTASVTSKKGDPPQVVILSTNGFDPNAVLNCGNVDISAIAKQLNASIFSQIGDFEVRQMFNIELYDDRNLDKIELKDSVQIKIRIPDELLEEDIELNIVYVREIEGENGEKQYIPVNMNARREGGYLVFDTDHLSNYAIVASFSDNPGPTPPPSDDDPVNPNNPVSGLGWQIIIIVGVLSGVVAVAIVILRRK